MKLIKTNLLKVDYSYHAPKDKERIVELVTNFDLAVANPIKVSHRDGKYYVVDGLSTLEAFKIAEGDEEILCRVFEGMTREEEASIYSRQNENVMPLTPDEYIRAMAVAGHKFLLDFQAVTKQNGFELVRDDEAAEGNTLTFSTALDAYQTLGSEEYGEMLAKLR